MFVFFFGPQAGDHMMFFVLPFFEPVLAPNSVKKHPGVVVVVFGVLFHFGLLAGGRLITVGIHLMQHL